MSERRPGRRKKSRRSRHEPESGLDAEHAAERGRHPDRTDAIRPERERPASRGDRSGRAAARSAAGAIESPGIAGYAGHRTVCRELVAGFAGRGLAGDDRAASRSAVTTAASTSGTKFSSAGAPPRPGRRRRNQILHVTGTPASGPCGRAVAPRFGRPVAAARAESNIGVTMTCTAASVSVERVDHLVDHLRGVKLPLR